MIKSKWSYLFLLSDISNYRSLQQSRPTYKTYTDNPRCNNYSQLVS